jgi:hypothetical protein
LEASTIVLTVHGRPDLTRDLSYGVGRAMIRLYKRLWPLEDTQMFDLACADTEEQVTMFVESIRSEEGLRWIDDWIEQQSEKVAYTKVCSNLAESLQALSMLDPTGLPHISFDMDGVYADFDRGYPLVFGHHHSCVSKEEMWKHIDSRPMFYADLPTMAHSRPFYRAINHLDHSFLSVSRGETIEKAKQLFLKTRLMSMADYVPVWGSRKSDYIKNRGDILVDDHEENIRLWEEAGGVGILHVDFRSTAHQLLKALKV